MPCANINHKLSLILLLLLATLASWGENRIFSSRVKTLTSMVGTDWQNRPVMSLGSDDVLHIGFDEFSHNYHRLPADHSQRVLSAEDEWQLPSDHH